MHRTSKSRRALFWRVSAGTGEYISYAYICRPLCRQRSEKQRCASVRAITVPFCSGASYFRRATRAKAPRRKVSRLSAAHQAHQAQSARIGRQPRQQSWHFVLTLPALLAGTATEHSGHARRAVEHRTRRTRWHSDFPKICRLAAGWLREGADHLRRPVHL